MNTIEGLLTVEVEFSKKKNTSFELHSWSNQFWFDEFIDCDLTSLIDYHDFNTQSAIQALELFR